MYFLFDSVVSTTLNVSLLDSLILGVIFYIIFLPFTVKKGLRKNIFYFLIFLYGSFLFFLTIPIVLQPYPEGFLLKTKWAFSEIIWNPLYSVRSIHTAAARIKLIGGNFFLLMPISIFQVIGNKKCSRKKILRIVLSISIGIEFLQFIGNIVIGYAYRTVELLDVILNVSGAMICFAVSEKVKNSFTAGVTEL